jgi:Flp pilus assembly protein TadG
VGRRFRDEGGQAVVEFALVLPLLLTIVFAIFQLGIAFHQYVELTDAVRAGARVAAVSATAADPVGASKAAVQSSASDLNLDPNAITVSSDWQSGHTVTVSAADPYTISIFGISVHSGSMTSSTTERVE